MAKFYKSLLGLAELWSLTRFDDKALSEYSESKMFADTRRGVVMLGLVSFLLLVSSAIVYAFLGYGSIYVYSCAVLAALSVHVVISAHAIEEARILYLLGITLLVVNGVAFVLLAHYSGTFSSALFASVVFLFLVMPLVPWGLREALLIVGLIYILFTFSTLSVQGRFEQETLLILQFAMFGASITTLTVIVRNILVRRGDIKTRYELERAHDRMALLSLKDPLTGAWNRRFLDERISDIRAEADRNQRELHFALIDIDDFKQLNDSRGHDFGDLILCRLVVQFSVPLTEHEYLLRMGGDEFLLILSCADPVAVVEQAAASLRTDPILLSRTDEFRERVSVQVSVGLVTVRPGLDLSLDVIYRQADQALYQAKQTKDQDAWSDRVVEVRGG